MNTGRQVLSWQRRNCEDAHNSGKANATHPKEPEKKKADPVVIKTPAATVTGTTTGFIRKVTKKKAKKSRKVL